MSQRDLSLLGNFIIFLIGMAMLYFGLMNGYPTSVVISGAVVGIIGLILVAPAMYRVRYDMFQFREQVWKSAWGKQWFYVVTVLAIANYLVYLLPTDVQKIGNVVLLLLVVISIAVMQTKMKKDPSGK